MKIVLWILQGLLALMFMGAGFMKLTSPIADLATQLPWANQIPEAFIRFIGASELLGGIGIILPSLLRIKPLLTPLAALGLVAIMVFALVFHISREEYSAVGINAVMATLALVVAWGRYKKIPIQAK